MIVFSQNNVCKEFALENAVVRVKHLDVFREIRPQGFDDLFRVNGFFGVIALGHCFPHLQFFKSAILVISGSLERNFGQSLDYVVLTLLSEFNLRIRHDTKKTVNYSRRQKNGFKKTKNNQKICGRE